jgi:hypothetical protein
VSRGLDRQVSGGRDLNQSIVTATYQREPGIDFLSAADLGLEGLPDSEVLEQATRDGRILITHDRRTMPVHFRARLESGETSAGILIVAQSASIASVVDAIVLIWAASEAAEWQNQIHHLPSLARHVFQH